MFDRLFSEVAGSPAWTLFVETTLKGTWLLILAALVVLTLRRASAAHRHFVWACALAGLVTLPILLALLPAWRVSAPALAWLAPAPYRASTPGSDNLASSVTKDAPAGSPKPAAQNAADPAPASPSHGIAVPTVAEPGPALVGRAAFSWPTIAIAAWLIGAIVVLLTFLAGHVVLRVLVRGARPVRDGEWHALALEVADQLRLTVPFVLLRADNVIVPAAFGLFRPRVLLPVACDTWPLDLRRAVLLHELAHVQRNDCLTQAVAQVACALFWFHPGVWWASSRLQIEREHACDDRVLEARTRPSDYADHLLDFVRSLRASRGAALGAVTFARRSTLEGRLLAVLDPLRNRSAVGSRVAAPAVLVAALLVLPFAAFEPVTAGSMHAKNTREKAVTDAKALRPSRVVPVPEAGSLAQRVAWTRSEANRSDEPAYWIGWLIETQPGEGNMLSDSHGISVDVLSLRGAFTLDDVLAGRDHGTNDAGERHGTTSPARKTVAVLVRISDGATDRVRVQTPSLPAEFSGEPLYWLDAVPEDQSFAWLRDAAGRESNDHLRGQLVESVSFMRNPELVTPYLVSMFRSAGSAQVRASAAEGLARHPSSETVALLADGARSDRSPQVRRACVEALGRVQTPMALEALLAIARRSEGDERRAAFDALGDQVSRDAPGDGEAEDAPRDAEAEAERARERMEDQPDRSGNNGVDDEGSQPMAQEDLEVQRQAIESLGRYPESQSLQQLRRIAQTSPNSDLRAEAVESIGRLGTPAALAVVEEIVWKNRHERARSAAVETMGRRFGPAQAVDKLSAIGRTHPSRDTRRTAVEMLGRLDGKDARDALDRIIAADGDPEVQRQAVESLGRRNDEDVERQLTEIARTHRSIEVRRQAVESLGRREGSRTVERMMELAQADGPQEVQRQAAESLGRIDDARVKGMLLDLAQNHPSIEIEEQAVESLGRLEIDVMSDLARIARTHRSSRVRRQAVESMTRRDPDQALPLLEEILRQPKRKTGT